MHKFRSPNPWTPEQLAYLKKHWGTASNYKLTVDLAPHPMNSIWFKARTLGLYRANHNDARFKPRPGLHPIVLQLREIRKEKNIKQESLAKDLGICRVSLQRKEVGRISIPGLTMLTAWAKLLGYEITLTKLP